MFTRFDLKSCHDGLKNVPSLSNVIFLHFLHISQNKVQCGPGSGKGTTVIISMGTMVVVTSIKVKPLDSAQIFTFHQAVRLGQDIQGVNQNIQISQQGVPRSEWQTFLLERKQVFSFSLILFVPSLLFSFFHCFILLLTLVRNTKEKK